VTALSTTDALKEFQDSARIAGQRTVFRAMERIAEKVETTEDFDWMLKLINGKLTDIAQAVPERKIDLNANLPTVNITFTAGGAQVTAHAAPLVEVVQEVQPAHPLDDLDPTPLMLTQRSINDDLDDILA
jgi:hypothetical protein